MRLVVQRVNRAHVSVDGRVVSSIGEGFVVFVGIGCEDTVREADYMAGKLMKLRIFPDCDGRMNHTLGDVDGSLLLVSQFTLYGDVIHHNRPSFNNAMRPDEAGELFDYLVDKCREGIGDVQTGCFGEFMNVYVENDGPVTIIVDKQF